MAWSQPKLQLLKHFCKLLPIDLTEPAYFLLEENFEADERGDLKDANSVNAAVTRPASDGHFLKTGFAQESLAESFESGRRKRLKHSSQFLSVVRYGC